VKDTPRDEKISSVRRDDYEEGHQAARYLIGLGHEALVTIVGRANEECRFDGLDGYRESIA